MRRYVLPILLCLLLGCLITTAVAWAIAWFSPEHALRNDVDAERFSALSHFDDRTWSVDVVQRFGMIHVTAEPGWTMAPSLAPASPERDRIPWWSIARTRRPEYDESTFPPFPRISETACGFPFLAMRYRYDWTNQPAGFSGNIHTFTRLHNAIPISDPNASGVNIWRNQIHALPLQPIWPSFLVNTFIYAAIIAFAIFGIRGTRRALRRSRNQCIACGYPIGTSPVCTECGRPIAFNQRAR